MNCIDCLSAMETFHQRGLTLERCSECGAMWFDGDEIVTYLKGASLARRIADCEFSVAAESLLRCPRCRVETMGRCRYGSILFTKCSRCDGIHVPRDSLPELIDTCTSRPPRPDLDMDRFDPGIDPGF